MQKIRMGIIGLGMIAPVHINGTLESNDAQLWALCDIDTKLLDETGEKYNIPKERLFTKYEDLIRSQEVDAVSICTPNNSHFDIAKEAIRSKKPFALEKPVGLKAEEVGELKRLADESNIINMICFSYRYKAAARYAKWIIDQGCLGRIYHTNVQYFQSWNPENIPMVWRFSKKLSGSGALGDLGSHMLDLTHFLLNKDVIKVIGHAGTFIKERKYADGSGSCAVDVDDYCNYLVQLDEDISATYAITRYGYGRGNYQRVEVYGSKGGLIYQLYDEDSLELCIGEAYNESKTFYKVRIPAHYKVSQMQSFFDLIKGKGDNKSATLEDGYINQKILDAILLSLEEERWIKLK